MNHLQLPDGSLIPMLGFGAYKLTEGQVEEAVIQAIHMGYRHFDCAFSYQNEAGVGRALAWALVNGIVKRTDLFVTSKLWNMYHRPDLVVEGCRDSLINLQLGFVDLYLMQWPLSYRSAEQLFSVDIDECAEFDDIAIEGTWKAMEALVSMGLARFIGLSNFNESQIERILQCAVVKPVMLQVQCQLGFPNRQLVDFAKSRGLFVTAYSPLSSSLSESHWEQLVFLPEVQHLSSKYGKTPTQILLRHMVHQNICVVPKSYYLNDTLDNFRIFDFELSAEDCELLNAVSHGTRRIQPAVMPSNPPVQLFE